MTGKAGADTRSAYAARMHRVQEHIDRHLDQPLDLATLAGVAHFSPFHFHRLFTAWMGETLGDHLRRRRLQVGAMRLLAQPRSTVLDVALSVGFGSAEAFARAFKLRFACSPSDWRQRHRRKPDQAGAALPGDDGGPFTPPFRPPPMNVTVVDRPAVTVATMRYVGPFGEAVGRFWGQRFEPWLARRGLRGRPLYGISHDDPTIVSPDACRYDAGVEVDANFVCDAGIVKTTLPGGRYAVLAYRGRSQDIGDAWTSMWRDWLPQSGWQFDARPCFEHYAPGFDLDPATGSFCCDICIPITPL